MKDRNNNPFFSHLPNELLKSIYESGVLSLSNLFSLANTAKFFHNDNFLKQQITEKMYTAFEIKQLAFHMMPQDFLYLLNCGLVAAYGNNKSGKLGLGEIDSVKSPTIIPSFKHVPIIKISMGCKSSLFLDEKNKLWVSGSNLEGQLGLGKDFDKVREPILLDLPFVVKDIMCGPDYSVIKDDKDTYYFCGSNYMNISGLGLERLTISEFTKLPPSNLLTFRSLPEKKDSEKMVLTAFIPEKYRAPFNADCTTTSSVTFPKKQVNNRFH